jgi:hypothetical protein
MEHRHLLPDEIDQLLDGETGFGIAPLTAHVRECAQCRAELEAGQRVVAAIEQLPRLAPSPLFAEHVMAQVQVYEPLDVTIRDAAGAWARRLIPQSRPLRVVAATGGLTIALALSVACVWLGTHIQAVFFFGSLVRARLRDAIVGQLGAVASGIFGSRAIEAVGTAGPVVLLAIAAAFVVLTFAAGFAVRSVVTTSRRGRA